jgi:hypothetical protein
VRVFQHLEEYYFAEQEQEGEEERKEFVLVHWRQTDASFDNFCKIYISQNTNL